MQLIDTEKDQYPATRKWAEAIHQQCPEAQGLSWVSRQDDSARAFVLFGDRIADSTLQQKGVSRSLIEDADAYTEALDLAERIGVEIVPGKS
ncbi:RES domain-containing protein [Caballeronia mineralivorans]|uniref:RES domain-containing protein n=1 Tax=Caballeronia mineralivorans TaxID=2010198 RepID=UPI000AFFB0D6|nr:RES domain-containing protein [Caballeronia mineralivorans]